MFSRLKKNSFFIGAFILTVSGMATRLIGFFFRIFLSKSLGTVSLGLYQLVLPITAFGFAVSGYGIQTAVSRYVAAHSISKTKASTLQRTIFFQGCILSLLFSLPLTFLISSNASFLAIHFFKEASLVTLIQIISLQIPISSLHCCINGYFIGRKNTTVPGLSQIIEQLFRVILTFIFWKYCIAHKVQFTPNLVILGALLGELFSLLLCILFFLLEKKEKSSTNRKNFSFYTQLLKLSGPITLNRIFLTSLTGLESILIPYSLKRSGLSSETALSLYGIFSGMAFTFILFPSSVIQSISTVLMPEVAELSSYNKNSNLEKTISSTLFFSISMGIFFNGIFATYGGDLSTCLFHEPLCSNYVKFLSFLCPFMYLNINISSILHGLECSLQPFFINLSGTLLKILSLLFFVPFYGMHGYFLGFLFSNIFESYFYLLILRKKISFTISFKEWILTPIFDTLSSIAISYFLKRGVLLFSPTFPSTLLYFILCVSESLLFFLLSFYRNKNKL